jgi:sensor domain CHASE-containing protein
MSLRSKIVLIVTLVVTAYAIGDHLLQRRTLLPSFAELERVEALEDVARVSAALQAEVDHLDDACRDRATLTSTFEFATAADEDERARYVAENLGARSMRQDELDLLYVIDREARVLWGEVRDWRSGATYALRDLPNERLSPNHAYLVTSDVRRGHESGAQRGWVSGLVQTEHGPMLLAARPILRSSGEGEVGGTLILGRFLNAGLIEELSRRTSVDVALWPLDGGDLPQAETAVLPDVTSSGEPLVVERGDEALDVYTTFADMRAAPALLVRAKVARDIWARGRDALRYALLSTLAAGMLLLLVLVGALQRAVLTPLARLTEHALHIGQNEDTTARLELAEGRQDEIGVLGREFDSMLGKLARSRAAVVETAREAGMSEIANGILHNVGNVLNSVNVAAGMLREKLRASKLPKLERLAGLAEERGERLGEYIASDPKGAKFGPFLCELTRSLRADESAMQSELATLEQGIEHIRRLVASQQSFAGKSGLREPTHLLQELEHAVEISARATEGLPAVEVEFDCEPLGAIRLDRHKLLEILVNVLKNAREALAERAGGRRVRMSLRAMRDSDGEPRAVIEVADNGPGIAHENLARVFLHGFTTKPGGHGFGLHASANAATELGGKLHVRSPGELGGATFVLELPAETVSRTRAPEAQAA